jgi:hypothetical protein
MWRIGRAPNSIPIYSHIQQDATLHSLFLYLEIAVCVSGGTSTHHQERIQLYLQHLVFVTPLLLSASIVEELEPVWVCYGWRGRVGTGLSVLWVAWKSWNRFECAVGGVKDLEPVWLWCGWRGRVGTGLSVLWVAWKSWNRFECAVGGVEWLEPVWVCCGWRTPPTAHSNRF